jgi:hypothetical protein
MNEYDETNETLYCQNWGDFKLEKLPKEIDINRLKQPKAILIDEPLLPSILKTDKEISALNDPDNKAKNKR